MSFRWPLTLLLVFLAASLCEAAKKVAVQDFSSVSNSLKAGEGELLGDALREGMDGLPAASFVMMTRENITELLPPGKTLEECSGSGGECEVTIGRLLGADYIVIGKVLRVDKQLVATVKAHRIQPVGVLLTRSVEGKGIGALRGAVTALGREVKAKLLEAEGMVGAVAANASTTAESESPAAVPAAGATKYVVNFESTPVGASVTVDGNFLCSTPCGKALAQGTHSVGMGKDGYHPKKEKLAVSRNNQQLSWSLEAVSIPLNLDAVDDRTGNDLVADVYVDGVKVGQTPYSGLVPIGAQKIEVAPEGFDRKSVSVALEEGKPASATAHFRSAEKPKMKEGMVRIPAGCFQMGSNDGNATEKPVHQVCLSAFSLDVTPVTQEAYQRVTGTTPWTSCGGEYCTPPDPKAPAYNVTWTESDAYCHRLGKRLPTEAEYEYANRAGSTTTYPWGNNSNDGCRYANVADHSAKRMWSGWTTFECDDGHAMLSPVASFLPNKFGLYDMSGNVWEWASDWYDKAYYSRSPSQDPTGPSSGSGRVFRGGGWNSSPADLVSAGRLGNDPGFRNNGLGFRCVGP